MVKGIGFFLALTCALWLRAAPVLALDVSQYGHTSWKYRDGLSKGSIEAIVQTPDGYLWLGTDSGLLRFDGVRAVPWQPPAGTSLPDSRIRVLLASRDGTLWIGTLGGLASWNGSKLVTYPLFGSINGLVEDRQGTIWATTGGRPPYTGLLCAIRSARVGCFGKDGGLGAFVGALHEAGDGGLWVIASKGVWRWKPGTPKLYLMPDRGGDPHALGESASGAALVLTANGIKQVVNDKVEPFFRSLMPENVRPTCVLRDRDRGLWVGTSDGGLIHIYNGRMDRFGRSDGLSSDQINALFEDREGNIWAATADGLDRLRAMPTTTYSAGEGLPLGAKSVLADRDGSIWLSTLTGLYRWRDGHMFAYRARRERLFAEASAAQAHGATAEEVVLAGLPERAMASLFQDRRGRVWFGSQKGLGYIEKDRFIAVPGVAAGFIDSIVEDPAGNIWIAHRDLGLLRLSPDLKVQKEALKIGVETGSVARLAVDPTHGDLWIGFFTGGVADFVDGKVRAFYSAADGLGKGFINDIRVTADGTVWAATDGGLSRIKAGRIATLNSSNGLPCDGVHTMIEGDTSSIWIYTACGLARIGRTDLDAWAAAVDQGKVLPTVLVAVLDDSDGVRSYYPRASSATPHLSKAPDGTLWLIAPDGASMVDPRHLRFNTLPPPVHVERIVADHRFYYPYSQIRLPPLVRDLQIDYTALSLAAPEKIQFRYKLEGRDSDWQDPGNRRQAFYSDLAPGNYSFRVIASNNNGVWNKRGATLAFSVAPAYWQTNWFRMLCVTGFGLLLWAVYQVRVRRLARAAVHEEEIQQRHRELHAELAHANRLTAMGQLMASITHEIRQPITSVLSNGYALRRWLDRAEIGEARQTIERIIQDAMRAGDIISGLRALVQKSPERMEYFDINAAIREVVVVTHGEAVRNNISVETQLADGLPSVYGDRVQLQQVLLNLIANAMEAMSGDQGVRDLVVRTGIAGSDSISVAVADTGPGLDAENAIRAFEAFYTTKPEGLGMGLSVCSSVVEAHGGTLTVTGNTPRGAVFEFVLPSKGTAAHG